MAKSALKFKDSVAQYERIAAEVAARRFSGIYLLMGEESYFIDALSDQLAATILDEAARAFNQITVYGRDSEAGQVINLCRQMPMMGQYQVVILKEAQQLKGLDKLALYTQKPSPTTILVICHKEKNADKRSAFYKGCAANGTVLESVRPRDYEIAAWLQQFIRQKGFTIDPKALSMLTDHLGTDIAKISNEIRKLTVSLPEGTQRITDADIEANIGISKDFNNFELCKAVVTRDMARALMIAEHFARNPKDNPLLLTVMALFGQFKELFVVNYLRWLTPQRTALSAGHGTDAHPAQEQHVRHRRDQAERRRMGQPQGVQHPRAAARIRRQEQGTGCGRRVGRRTAARTAAENLSALTGLYLYQTVHLARGRARNVAGHIAVLDAASRELFGRPYAPAAERLAKRIETLSAAERYPAGVSGFVRIELDPDGTERLLPAGVSLYDGYAFRSLQPEAVTVGYDLTLSEAPTSAREAAAQLARRLAERRGAEVAVRCDSAGILRSADDAPLLAIAGRTVLTVPGPASVERRLAMLAVRAAGLELREEAFGRADLPSLDELFFADHRGVTSLSRCDGQPLMTFVAERIAEAMEGLFPKK